MEAVRDLFETEWQSSAEVYLPGGRPPWPGEPLGTLLREPYRGPETGALSAAADPRGMQGHAVGR